MHKFKWRLVFPKNITALHISSRVDIPVEIKVYFFCLAISSTRFKSTIIADAILLNLKLNFLQNSKLSKSQADANQSISLELQYLLISEYSSKLSSNPSF